MSDELGPTDLEALLLGGAFFGSGGGGTVTSARHLASHFKQGDYYPTEKIRVVTVEEATAGEAVMVAYMGAPEAINHTFYPIGPVEAAKQVQVNLASQGKQLAYVVSPESGALGFLVAGLVAAKLGLSVIDADGAGRAVPSLPMLTYAAAEISPRPTILVSQGGLRVELDVTPSDGRDGGAAHQQNVSVIVEQMTRPIVAAPQFGEFGGLAMWIMTPAQLPVALPIRGTLSRALALGKTLETDGIKTAAAMIAHLAKEYGITAYAVSPGGKLISAEVDTTGGFDLGKIRLRAAGHVYTVVYQNESLLAWDSALPHPVVLAPDSLAYFVEGEGQRVFSNGDLVLPDGKINPVVNDRPVCLLAWEADPELRKPGGLILDSFRHLLAQMGYLGPYVPVENLQQNQQGAQS
jgi:DUF917 family protein